MQLISIISKAQSRHLSVMRKSFNFLWLLSVEIYIIFYIKFYLHLLKFLSFSWLIYSRLWLYFSIQMLFTKECLWGCILLYSSIIFLYRVEILLHGEALYSAQDLLWTNLGFSSMIYKLDGGCCCCCVCVYIYIWSFLVWHQSKQNLNPINHLSLTFTNKKFKLSKSILCATNILFSFLIYMSPIDGFVSITDFTFYQAQDIHRLPYIMWEFDMFCFFSIHIFFSNCCLSDLTANMISMSVDLCGWVLEKCSNSHVICQSEATLKNIDKLIIGR